MINIQSSYQARHSKLNSKCRLLLLRRCALLSLVALACAPMETNAHSVTTRSHTRHCIPLRTARLTDAATSVKCQAPNVLNALILARKITARPGSALHSLDAITIAPTETTVITITTPQRTYLSMISKRAQTTVAIFARSWALCARLARYLRARRSMITPHYSPATDIIAARRQSLACARSVTRPTSSMLFVGKWTLQKIKTLTLASSHSELITLGLLI